MDRARLRVFNEPEALDVRIEQLTWLLPLDDWSSGQEVKQPFTPARELR
jgi:hypothetical protein